MRTFLPGFFFLALLLADAPAFALREFHERERPQRSCNLSAVADCVRQMQDTAAALRSHINAADPRLAAISGRRSEIRKLLSKLTVEKDALAANGRALTLELDFLRAAPLAPPEPVIPGALSLDDLFRTGPLQRGWRERYPAERAERLSAELREAGKKEADLNKRLSAISADFARADSEFQSAFAQKNKWIEEIYALEKNPGDTCRTSVCHQD